MCRHRKVSRPLVSSLSSTRALASNDSPVGAASAAPTQTSLGGKMRFWKQGAIAFLTLAVAMPVKAQEDVPTVTVAKKNTGAGTTSAEFLLMGAGARGMALGPAFGAITRDVES